MPALSLPGIVVLTPRRFADGRGFFSEIYSRDTLARAGVNCAFVQDNFSRSEQKGTVRGLHFQRPPHAQAKLVQVLQGAVYDVAVDIRHGSPTFGKFAATVLSKASWNQMFVPAGFAHGFMTLEPATEVLYKVSALYAPEADSGIVWDDPAIAIDWPLAGATPILSDKDATLPRLHDLGAIFPYEKFR